MGDDKAAAGKTGRVVRDATERAVELADVIDAPAIQEMMDAFYGLTGIGIGIIDLKGKVLVATGWQDICTKFHRVHPETRRHCVESDIVLSSGVERGVFKRYRCKNHLWHIATPIMLGEQHAGNIFLGQFLFEDEAPDREVFRAQARRYGFDEAAYLSALDRLPRWRRERVNQVMTFYAAFARQISNLSYGNIELARTLAQRDELLGRLGENEERLRLALKATNDVVWDWDIVNDAQRWNESGAVVFGWTDIVETYQTAAWWVDRIHPEDRRRVDAAFFAAVRDPAVERWSDEYRFRKADGAYSHVADRGYILRDAEGRAVRMIGAMLDITERKRTEQALHESEERFSKAFHTSPYAITITRAADGRFIETNAAFTAISGYSREEALAGSSISLNLWTNPADRAAVIAALNGGRAVTNREHWFRRKDGSMMVGLFSAQSIQLGAERCILSSINDITELRRNQKERDRLEQQLNQAQKMESVGRLAGGVAHDFNNMLNIILGYGEMLLDDLHPADPLRGNVKEIVTAAKRSSDLTRQLLAFARKQALQPKVMFLNDIVRIFDKMLRRIIGEDIELRLALAENMGPVRVDQGQIEQVITNLAVNARDAMPEGGKLIIETETIELDETYAETHPGARPGRYAMLAMSDTGCGMNKDVVSRIFEPFYTTKEMGRGTGLGLSTVYGIVKQSDGNIWVYSELGKGTTFKIYLPETHMEPEPRTGGNETPVAEGAGQRILVVEDEAGLRQLLAASLSRLGYKVTVAANGGEALLIMEEEGGGPDLVITDVVMPNMSGKELVDRLRRNRPDLKALYMSGYTDNVIVHHGVLDPDIPFIQKPFTVRDMAEKVRKVLGETRRRGETPA